MIFENIKNLVISQVIERCSNVETYIVCDVYARFSIYMVGDETALCSLLREDLGDKVEKIFCIEKGSMIYEDLNHKDYIQPILIDNQVYYVDRHISLTNWDIQNRFESAAKIVGFYSFKGGLGRTTALVLTAMHLARTGAKVVLLDFDIEAPGLATLFVNDYPDLSKIGGVVDYLVDLSCIKYEDDIIKLEDYYYTINQQGIVGSMGGELLVFPASKMDESENLYMSKLSKLNLIFQSNSHFGVDILLDRINSQLKPDIILVDIRTGLNDIGGLFLSRYVSDAFLFFYGNQQNMFGLESLLPKLKSHEKLNFYLVNSPVPKAPLAEEERKFYLDKAYVLFTDLYYSQEDSSPYIDDKTARHYPIEVPFNDLAVLLDSSEKLKSLLDENGNQNPYGEMSRIIFGSQTLLDKNKTVEHDTEQSSQKLLEALKNLVPSSAASEYEFETLEELTQNFYPRKDYKFIFDKTKYLIFGEKGSGKTALYAVLANREYAVALAKYCDADIAEISVTEWIKGYDKTQEYPSSDVFVSLKDKENSVIKNFWRLLILKYCTALHPYQQNIQAMTWRELLDEAEKDKIALDLEQYFSEINKTLTENKKFFTIVYDYLDLLTEENGLRGRLITALLEVWRDIQNRYPQIRTKIFLRKDIFDREVNLTDKVKFNNHSSEINWEYDQLLNVVWKRLLNSNIALPSWFNNISVNNVKKEGILGTVPNFSEKENKDIFYKLVGEYMGSNNKASPYKWIIYHVSDTHRKIQPRSLLNLFSKAAQLQLEKRDFDNNSFLKPRYMELVLAEVSATRVQDIREEYPLLAPIFEGLKSHLDYFPIEESKLSRAIDRIRDKEKLTKSVSEIKAELESIGVLYEYKYTKREEKRYHIPDLYLFGMGLKRRGPGAHKALFGKSI